MGQNITRKIIAEHLVSGEMIAGSEIAIRRIRLPQMLDQGLPHLNMGLVVKTELSVSYVDHNTLQTGFENVDHRDLQLWLNGIHFSR